MQTAVPGHPVVAARRAGRPLAFQRAVLREREENGLPPVGEMIAIEASGSEQGVDLDAIGSAATVLGPAATGSGQRWLIQGSDLRDVRIRLRSTVQSWRERGITVRIDADPLDL